MTIPPDHYATLGVNATATPAQISHAYRTLIRSLHPDTTTMPGDTRAPFTAVTTAYRILRDPARRAAYDRSRRSSSPAQPSQPSQRPPQIRTTVHVTVTPTAAPPRPAAREPLLRVGPVQISPLP